MDVLSDVIATMRTGAPHSARIERQAPWGQRYASVPGAGFHVVLQGSCWLIPREGAPVPLGVGDVVFLPHGSGNGLADSPSTPLADPVCDPQGDARFEQRYGAQPVNRRLRDGERADTVTLCGAYQLDPARAHPLLNDLPEIVHLPARLGRRPELRAAVDLLGGELERPRHGVDAIVPALLDMLLLYILRAWFDEQPDPAHRRAGARRSTTRRSARRCTASTASRHGHGPSKGWASGWGCPGRPSRGGSPRWSGSRRSPT